MFRKIVVVMSLFVLLLIAFSGLVSRMGNCPLEGSSKISLKVAGAISAIGVDVEQQRSDDGCFHQATKYYYVADGEKVPVFEGTGSSGYAIPPGEYQAEYQLGK